VHLEYFKGEGSLRRRNPRPRFAAGRPRRSHFAARGNASRWRASLLMSRLHWEWLRLQRRPRRSRKTIRRIKHPNIVSTWGGILLHWRSLTLVMLFLLVRTQQKQLPELATNTCELTAPVVGDLREACQNPL
jgi:hypothetical protein